MNIGESFIKRVSYFLPSELISAVPSLDGTEQLFYIIDLVSCFLSVGDRNQRHLITKSFLDGLTFSSLKFGFIL